MVCFRHTQTTKGVDGMNFLFGISVCLNIVFIIVFILAIRLINKTGLLSLFKKEKEPSFKDSIVNLKEFNDFFNKENVDFEEFLK